MAKSVQISAPGKVILHGEHAVVYYKPAIAISVALFTKLEVSRKVDGEEVSLKFDEIGLDVSIPLEDVRGLQEKLGPNYSYKILNTHSSILLDSQYVEVIGDFLKNQLKFSPTENPAVASSQLKAVEAFLGLYAAIFDEQLEPLLLNIKTDLPVGAGLGSSASFAVALAAGMLISTGRVSAKLDQNGDTDQVNRWAYFSEKFVHGSPSGIDNYVTTYGGAVFFQRQQNGQSDQVERLECPEIRALLVDTKTPRSTHAIIQKAKAMREEQPEEWEKIMNEIGDLVLDAAKGIKNNSVQPEIFSQNHKLLQAIGVSHERLDRIVELGKSHGFHGKLTGAGGGGCAFVYIPKGQEEEDDQSVKSLKESLTSEGFRFWDTKLGCEGVRVVN